MSVKETSSAAPLGGIPAGNATITVGVHSAESEHTHSSADDGTTVGDIAGWHEWGTATIPARSWCRAWFDERQDFIQATLMSRMKAAMAGHLTYQQALEQIALACEGDVKRRIKSNIPPPLAPATIARKGSSVALIDTSQLVNAIRAKVEVK